MKLHFPNTNRSFDARWGCVRFWAYDESLEIPFFIDVDALTHLAPQSALDEHGLLNAFDQHRDRICKAAGRVYQRNSRGSYVLRADDM